MRGFKLIIKVNEDSYSAQVSIPRKGELYGLFWTGVGDDVVLCPIKNKSEFPGQTSVDIWEMYNIFEAFLNQVRDNDILYDDFART